MKDIHLFSFNSLIYLLANIIGAALPFLLLPFLARELGPVEYGKIGLVASIYALLLTVAGLGTHAFVRTSYHQCSEPERRLVLGNAILLVAVASIVSLLLATVFGYAFHLPMPLRYIFVGIFSVFGQILISIRLVIWQMAGKAVRYGLLSVVLTALNLLLSILLVFVAQLEAEGRILGMWLPAMLVGPLIMGFMYKKEEVDFTFSSDLASRMLRFGLPLIPHSLALTFIVFVERAVLSKNEDNTALGVYFAAFQLALPISILVRSVNLQFRAWSDKMMAAKDHVPVVVASYLVMMGFLAAALVYAYFLQFFYADIVGAQLASGYRVSVILIFAAMFRGFYLVVSKALFFSGNTVLLMIITVCLCVIFSGALLFSDSIYTVAYLNLGFNMLLFLSVWIASAKVYPQPWLDLPLEGINILRR